MVILMAKMCGLMALFVWRRANRADKRLGADHKGSRPAHFFRQPDDAQSLI